MSLNDNKFKYYISIITNEENGIKNENEIYKNYPYSDH